MGLFLGLPVGVTGIVLLADSWPYVSLYLDGPKDELVKCLVGWVLVAAGALASFGDEIWFVDSRSRSFVRTWRFLRWPLRVRTVDLGSIGAVRCERVVTGNGAHEAFAVEIVLPEGKICRLATRTHLQEALVLAASLRELLDMPVEPTPSASS